MKRKSTEMDDANWLALEHIAADCDCFYQGKPSWRRLLTLIARGVLVVTVKDKLKVHASGRNTNAGRQASRHAALKRHWMRRQATMRRTRNSNKNRTVRERFSDKLRPEFG
jgi:hypothetical protein